MANPPKQAAYGEASIRVLKGLEPVKQRPGMYTRTDTPLHIVQEVIDNAADEALAGYGKRIAVTLHVDGSVSVDDDVRGMDADAQPHRRVRAADPADLLDLAQQLECRQNGRPHARELEQQGVAVALDEAPAMAGQHDVLHLRHEAQPAGDDVHLGGVHQAHRLREVGEQEGSTLSRQTL